MNDELIETVGRRIFQEAAVNPFAEVPRNGAYDLARRVLHREVVCEYDAKGTSRASIQEWGGKMRIAVPRWLPDGKKNWAVAFHLGREVLANEASYRSMGEEDQERAATALAGWLTAPPEPLLAKYQQVGFNVPAIAKAFVLSQTATALRLHEVTGRSLAVVADAANDGGVEQKRHVYRRGTQLSWLHEDALHELARKSNPKRVKKIVIRDAPRRTLLVASG